MRHWSARQSLNAASWAANPVVSGFGGGFWLDGVLGTKPWLSFVGFFFGLAAGVLNVYRVLQLSNKK